MNKSPPKRIDDLNNGSLLVEVATEEQNHRIRGLWKLVDTEVEVTEHQKLNTIQGTIKYHNKSNLSQKEILDTLKKRIVSNCYNILYQWRITARQEQPAFSSWFSMRVHCQIMWKSDTRYVTSESTSHALDDATTVKTLAMGQRAARLKGKCAPDVAKNIIVNAKTPQVQQLLGGTWSILAIMLKLSHRTRDLNHTN